MPKKSKAQKSKKGGGKKKGGQTFRGKGDVSFSRPLRTLGGAAGAYYGYPTLGRALGAFGDEFVGMGDYVVKTNSLMQAGAFVPIPKFTTQGRRGTRVVEREFIGNVFSSGSFRNDVYPINPGMASTFPWLCQLASTFEEYELNGLVFEFVPLSASWNGVNQSLGYIVLATDYNPSEPPYASKVSMENADYSTSGPPVQSLLHPVECDPAERPTRVSYVRGGGIGSNQDVKFYDLGNFQVGVGGFNAADQVVGELWVSYDVTFYKKALETSLAGWSLVNGVAPNSADYFGTLGPVMGTLPMSKAGNKSLALFAPYGSTVGLRVCPQGDYLVQFFYPQSAGNFTGPGAVTSTTDCTVLVPSVISNPAPGFVYSPSEAAGTNTANPYFQVVVRVTGPYPSISWSGTIAFGTAASVTIWLIRLPTTPLTAFA